LEIVGKFQPGDRLSILSNQAARILTGAVMPAGADTVVMQEQTRREDKRLNLGFSKPQAFVRHRASFYQAGTPLLPPGIILNAEIAVLAAAQCTHLTVYRRPLRGNFIHWR